MKKLLPIVILSAFCSSCRTYQPAWDMLSNEEKSILETSFGKIVYKEKNDYVVSEDVVLSNKNHNDLTLMLNSTIKTKVDLYGLGLFANIFTFGLFSLTGVPVHKWESTATLQAYSNEQLGPYIGTGSAYTACYYGYSQEFASKQSRSNALHDALKKIAIDYSKKENKTKINDVSKNKRNDRLKFEKILQKNKHNTLKRVVENGWVVDKKDDVFKTDIEKKQEQENKINNFAKWINDTYGTDYLLFLQDASIDSSNKSKNTPVSVKLNPEISYNPNTEMLSIDTSKISLIESYSEDYGDLIGMNPLGLQIKVLNSYHTRYTCHPKGINNQLIPMRISPQKLKSIKDDLKFVFVIKSSGEYTVEKHWYKPTINSPISGSLTEYKLSGDLQYLFLYDAKNKKILLDLME